MGFLHSRKAKKQQETIKKTRNDDLKKTLFFIISYMSSLFGFFISYHFLAFNSLLHFESNIDKVNWRGENFIIVAKM
jgi:hypothetical protein